MRRFVLIPAVLVALAVVPAAASAQGAPDFRDRFTDEYPIENFCDTGVTVQAVESTVANVWGLEGENTFKLTFRTQLAFTYGDTTVYSLSAGRVDVVRVEGTFPGPRIDLVVETGVRATLRVPGEGMLTIDHGYLEYLVSFDENGDFVEAQVLKDAGGHPAFISDVFCDAAIEALGIPTG